LRGMGRAPRVHLGRIGPHLGLPPRYLNHSRT
jgi:hypothetical protein